MDIFGGDDSTYHNMLLVSLNTFDQEETFPHVFQNRSGALCILIVGLRRRKFIKE